MYHGLIIYLMRTLVSTPGALGRERARARSSFSEGICKQVSRLGIDLPETPSHSVFEQWHCVSFVRLTVAGTVREFHPRSLGGSPPAL